VRLECVSNPASTKFHYNKESFIAMAITRFEDSLTAFLGNNGTKGDIK